MVLNICATRGSLHEARNPLQEVIESRSSIRTAVDVIMYSAPRRAGQLVSLTTQKTGHTVEGTPTGRRVMGEIASSLEQLYRSCCIPDPAGIDLPRDLGHSVFG